jgi:hypothetical protein
VGSGILKLRVKIKQYQKRGMCADDFVIERSEFKIIGLVLC